MSGVSSHDSANSASNLDDLSRRLKILAYIGENVAEGRGSPTDREITDALGISSISDVHFHIQYMELNGWITSYKTKKGHRRTGTIRLTDLGRRQLQPPEQAAEETGEETPAAPEEPVINETPVEDEAAQSELPAQVEEPKKSLSGTQKRVLDVGYVILSARISDRKAVRTVTIPVLNLIAASFGAELHSSDFSLNGLGAESYLNISQDMLGRLRIEDLYALEVRGDSMQDAGIQSGDYVILKRTQTAENGDMCAVWIDGREATLKYFYREEKRVRLEAANSQVPPRLIGPSHNVVIQGKVVLVVRV